MMRTHSTPNPAHASQGMDWCPISAAQTCDFLSASPADSQDVLPCSPPETKHASQSPLTASPLILFPAGPGLGVLTTPGSGAYLANAPDWLQLWSPGSMGKPAPSAVPERLAAQLPLSLFSEQDAPFRNPARQLFSMATPSPPQPARPAGLCVPPLPQHLPGSSPGSAAADLEDDLLLPQFPGLGCSQELLHHEQPAPGAFKYALGLAAAGSPSEAQPAWGSGPGVEDGPIADLMNACGLMPMDGLSLDFSGFL